MKILLPPFKSAEEIKEYKHTFITDDPAFGWSNFNGNLTDIIDETKLNGLKEKISGVKDADAIIVYGYGAAIPVLKELYDILFYADITQQQLLWQMWDGELIPFGQDQPRDYF